MPEIVTDVPAVLLQYVLPALGVLMIVVFVHEMGHFLVARWCGIKVAAFSIGFGREIVGWTDRHGARWKVSLIPLGGYVRFEGDENSASLPDAEALERIPAREREGMFHFAPIWKRAAVVAAGPIANFVLAILVFTVLFAVYGKPASTPRVDEVVAGSPAEAAGFQSGDVIVAIDGDPIDSFSQLQRIVTLAAGNTLQIDVERNGRRLALEAVPERREIPDGLGGTQRVGVLGISRNIGASDVTLQKFGVAGAFREGVSETVMIVERTMTYVGRLFAGRETADQLSGPIRVAQVSGVVASNGGLPALTHLMAVLSVSIGLLNLFPVPMLDGGHLVFYFLEALRGRPLSPRAQDIGFRVGFALVVMLFVFVTFNDIVKLAGI